MRACLVLLVLACLCSWFTGIVVNLASGVALRLSWRRVGSAVGRFPLDVGAICAELLWLGFEYLVA